ncbi:DUF1127 domain-containing protein [Roseicella aquatilis]|uniref:DUF1127 domain-containing protein n=1 Tax=Roseicella aquatilis TaxID=2527868 RepID=A0A4R4DER2_9PROT|nr:DUF1127 domain-containing protein [Roseicella aquatilis]
MAEAFSRGLARLGNALFGWVQRSRLRAELEALSDRELADIGLTRGDIRRVLVEAEAKPQTPARRPVGMPVPRPV